MIRKNVTNKKEKSGNRLRSTDESDVGVGYIIQISASTVKREKRVKGLSTEK